MRQKEATLKFVIAALAVILTWGVNTLAAPPELTYAFVNGQWWNGSSFEKRTFYTRRGSLTSKKPEKVDETIDLHGQFVIPPLAEGHNHWLEPAKIEAYNSCYLADGIYYVRDMANIPYLVDKFRAKVNLSNSVDWVSAMTSFTGPGGHPVEIIDQFVTFGILPKEWVPDYDKQAEFVVQTQKDVDERFDLLLQQHPAYVKAFLLYSDRYAENLKDPKTRGNSRGMNPDLLPYLVKRSHAAGLKTIVHIYSTADFRNAVASGADEIAHFPGDGYRPEMPISDFQITEADANAAAKAHIKITSTLSWLTDLKEEDPPHYKIAKDEVVIPNMKLLKRAGVPILIGSDKFRRDVIPELNVMQSLGIFSNSELLKMDTEATAEAIFPNRKIGKLKDGYEASFLVLDRDPTASLDNLSSIALRVKKGIKITVPASAASRSSPDCTQEAP